jgi:tripartite-type tricarboxylate transporter receptor subunit TctC
MKAIASISMVLAIFVTFVASAQEASRYPERGARIVVNVAPGGGVDAAARAIAQKLGERFGQTFVVENRGGGSGRRSSLSRRARRIHAPCRTGGDDFHQ